MTQNLTHSHVITAIKSIAKASIDTYDICDFIRQTYPAVWSALNRKYAGKDRYSEKSYVGGFLHRMEKIGMIKSWVYVNSPPGAPTQKIQTWSL